MKFHEDRCKGEAVMRAKPFYLTARLQTDGQTDGQGDSSIPPPPPNFVAGGIKIPFPQWDSNPQPFDSKSDALPTELAGLGECYPFK